MIGEDHIKPEIRGSVSGAYSFCGTIGIIIISKVGGVLFDVWMKGAPFLLLGIGHCIVAAFASCLFLYRFIPSMLRSRQGEAAQHSV